MVSSQRPDEIFVVGDPVGQAWAEPALPRSMDKIREPQGSMHEKVVSKVCVAGNVQFKRITLHQLAVHDNAHTAIVARRHDAREQDANFRRHRAIRQFHLSLERELNLARYVSNRSFVVCSDLASYLLL